VDTKVFSRTVSLFAALTLLACAPRNPAKPIDPADLQAKEKATSTDGGQPGKISVHGVIANAPELATDARAGKGKDGKTPEVAQANQAARSATLPAQRPAAPSEAALKKAYAYGCSAEQIAKYLGRDKSDEMDAEEQKSNNDSQKTVVAGRVVLCGKDPLKANAQIAITAQELILVDADLTFSGAAGLSLAAEKLLAVGANKITSIAPDSDNTAMAGGPVTLIVSREADLKDATLAIAAQGANYKAK